MVLALAELIRLVLKIVAQIIKTEFVICAISDVGIIRLAARTRTKMIQPFVSMLLRIQILRVIES